MVARVTLEIALRKEFDYSIPEALTGTVMVGTRVKVPFGSRQVMGVVTDLVESSPHATLKAIVKVVGTPGLVTPKVLELARWIGEYYCCPVETSLKSVLPDAVRKEKEGWRHRLLVRAMPITGERPDLTKRQAEVWNIIEEWRELPMQELLRISETTPGTVRRLEDKGMVVISSEISERDPYGKEHILPSQPLVLNPEQAVSLKQILKALDDPDKPEKVFLLHGVTGSGKTEVYLQAIAHALEQGKGAIVLVPEISLTPQTVERFKSRFSVGKQATLIAVLHSHLSSGERHDEWHKIRQGRARIVIGARSAIFAPVEPLGLIIVDEEHEPSYKQEEAPRYHARDVAVVRGFREKAVVVLGSATPSVESFSNVKRGKYALLEMPTRVDDRKMPVVKVVDMRRESHKGKGPPIFSLALKEAMTQRLERKEQTILFLNRRGYSTSLQCTICGYVAECPNCSIALTFHRQAAKLKCHICNYEGQVPKRCPEASCGNPAIRYSGLGTEKVEETLSRLFPKAQVRRMDSDVMKRKEDYRRILGEFRTGKIDILVGTQMIAKGLHFPNVTLVGIIHADLGLHIPDFRAGERTFQLLTQVAGRAGRGDREGEVVVQTFTPFHPAIQYARQHDFEGFYDQEMEFRRELRYPPFSRIAMVTVKGRNEDKVEFAIEHFKKEVQAGTREIEDLILSGPAPAPLARAETFYRYQFMLRSRQMTRLSRQLAVLAGKLSLPDDLTVTIDVDPVNMA